MSLNLQQDQLGLIRLDGISPCDDDDDFRESGTDETRGALDGRRSVRFCSVAECSSGTTRDEGFGRPRNADNDDALRRQLRGAAAAGPACVQISSEDADSAGVEDFPDSPVT